MSMSFLKGPVLRMHMLRQPYYYIFPRDLDRWLIDAIAKGEIELFRGMKERKGIVIRSLRERPDGTLERKDTVIARFPKKDPLKDPKND